jgi:hypothetical protein
VGASIGIATPIVISETSMTWLAAVRGSHPEILHGSAALRLWDVIFHRAAVP